MTAFEEHLENLKLEKGWNSTYTEWEQPDSYLCEYDIDGTPLDARGERADSCAFEIDEASLIT